MYYMRSSDRLEASLSIILHQVEDTMSVITTTNRQPRQGKRGYVEGEIFGRKPGLFMEKVLQSEISECLPGCLQEPVE